MEYSNNHWNQPGGYAPTFNYTSGVHHTQQLDHRPTSTLYDGDDFPYHEEELMRTNFAQMSFYGSPSSRQPQQQPSPQQQTQTHTQGFSRKAQTVPSVCRFFAQGNCMKGSQCRFMHLMPTAGSNSLAGSSTFGDRRTGAMYRGKPGPYDNQLEYAANVNSAEMLKGDIVRLSRQQAGCRLLQRLVENEPNRTLIFNEVFESLNQLVTDAFGHHLCLKLLDFLQTAKRTKMLEQIKDDLVSTSLNVHGTRVVQKMLECMDSSPEFAITAQAFDAFIITLAKDVYGMHVVLRCLHRIPAVPDKKDPNKTDNNFIFKQITSNIVSVATHKHGCCVVQWCIDYASPDQRKDLVKAIVINALELAQDAFGNYVLQQIMDTAQPETLKKLCHRLKGSMSKLAVQKFSSIVVEKTIEMCVESRGEIIKELVCSSKIKRLLQDPYANYVIQKILSVTRQDEFHDVVDNIRPHLDSLGATLFGKRIKTQMIRKFPILSMTTRAKMINTSTSEATMNTNGEVNTKDSNNNPSTATTISSVPTSTTSVNIQNQPIVKPKEKTTELVGLTNQPGQAIKMMENQI